jgi:hypothetical protein
MTRLKASNNKILPGHSPFGGSVAARVLRCPASVNLVANVPAHLRKPSTYADRGTACHGAMALLLDDNDEHSLTSLIGKTIGHYTLTRDDVEDALRPAYTYVQELLTAPGAAYYLEHRVTFPGIADAFGTVDLIVRIGRTIHVIDFKFGIGVRVLALYPDGDEDVLNAQLMYYAAAARYSLPEFFAGAEDVILTIVQPLSVELDAEMISSVTVTDVELDEFVTAYRSAREQALSDAPRLERGAWCRFCAARPICAAHTSPLLDLAQLVVPAAFAVPKQAYLQLLADGLTLVDTVKDIGIALRDQAKRALQNGDVVPGYALSAGRAERHWHDESAAIAALVDLGFARDDLIAETMRSPKQVEIRARARGLKIPPELISSSRSGVSLVRSENAHAPAPGRDEIVRAFSAALEAFKEEGNHDQAQP